MATDLDPVRDAVGVLGTDCRGLAEQQHECSHESEGHADRQSRVKPTHDGPLGFVRATESLTYARPGASRPSKTVSTRPVTLSSRRKSRNDGSRTAVANR